MTVYSTAAFTSSYYDNVHPEDLHWLDAIIVIPISTNPDKIKSFILNMIEDSKAIDKKDQLVIYTASSPMYNREIKTLLEENKTVIVIGTSYQHLSETKVKSVCNLALGKTGNVVSPDATMYDKDSYNVAIICLDSLTDCDQLIPGIKDEFEGKIWTGAKKDNYIMGVDIYVNHLDN
jgi:NAD-dependent SIR2 family protein deacetylase